eukprot:m.363652 g.363652  ORF g.363652 m.363652 type:complete len:62 (-) comp23347_c0_seq1:1878-2063(-)
MDLSTFLAKLLSFLNDERLLSVEHMLSLCRHHAPLHTPSRAFYLCLYFIAEVTLRHQFTIP